jgi:DNA-binding MarR family transcriptional regulator
MPRFDCTCGRLRKFTRRLTRIYDAHLVGSGMNVNQYSVLAHAAEQRYTVTELANALEMERTTLTRNLRPLTDAGWLTLVPGTDLRSREIQLTPAGRRQLARARRAWQGAQREVEATLGVALVVGLHGHIARAMRALHAAYS